MMLDDLITLAQDVGNVINQIPIAERGKTIEMGADGTPTSHIDKVAEKIILDHVAAHDLPLNVLSEEAGFVDRGYENVLVIDPVDGTSNAKRNIPYFSISLAVGQDDLDGIRIGIVYNPCTGDLYHSEKGEGAYFNGKRLGPSNDSGDGDGDNRELMICTHFGGRTNGRINEIIKNFKKIRALGCASLDICSVAADQSDAYYFNIDEPDERLRVTDIAAAVLILREAGGQIHDLTGNPLEMKLNLKDRKNMIALMNNDLLGEFI